MEVKEDLHVDDYVYEEKRYGGFDVTKIFKFREDAVYGYWAIGLPSLPKTLEEFNSLDFRDTLQSGDINNIQALKFEGETSDAYDTVTDSDCGRYSHNDVISIVEGYGDLVELKTEIVSNLSNLDNYDSKILMGLANLSEEEALDYFLNIVVPNTASIVQSARIRQ